MSFFYYSWFLFVLFFIFFKTQHMLSFLLSVELLVLLAVCLFLSSSVFSHIQLLVVFLSVSVCESILGMVLFIIFTRVYGKDYLSTLNVLEF